jgi:hypothetical protein
MILVASAGREAFLTPSKEIVRRPYGDAGGFYRPKEEYDTKQEATSSSDSFFGLTMILDTGFSPSLGNLKGERLLTKKVSRWSTAADEVLVTTC